MFSVKDYFQIAKENEAIFRNILRDLKEHRDVRPGGEVVPNNLKVESPLEEIFDIYSRENSYGKFTIIDFSRPKPNLATITFKNATALSGCAAQLEYIIKQDGSIKYKKDRMYFRS